MTKLVGRIESLQSVLTIIAIVFNQRKFAMCFTDHCQRVNLLARQYTSSVHKKENQKLKNKAYLWKVTGSEIVARYRYFLPYPKEKFERTDIRGTLHWTLKYVLTE